MSPPNSALFLPSLLLIIISTTVKTYSQDHNQDNTPFVTYCYGDSLNSSSSYYNSKLRLLLADLITSTPKSPSFFSLINSTNPQIFGLAQCRPDLNSSVCANCLNQSAVASTNNQGCGLNKSFANRARNCLLRFSDQNFYGASEEKMFVYNKFEVNASAAFNRRVNILMKSVTEAAAAASLRFAVNFAEDAVDAEEIYGMGWCSMDLASSDCAQCLGVVLERIPNGKISGEGGTVSCAARFETYQFYSSIGTAPAPEPAGESGKRSTKKTIAIVSGTTGAIALLLFFAFFILLLHRRKQKITASITSTGNVLEDGILNKIDVILMEFSAIKNATNNFAKENKLGQGGFGPVYKGMLINGQEIAVKRLSATSRQGLEEMKNEINFTAKLQHKNLVRLLGYCLEQNEKLLVYEYLPNTSLDKFLFDPIKKIQLDWETRFQIIVGISQGLLYLHEDSHLRIVHRDLKASNILLDSNMKPKISDFGLAKLFNVDETERNTCRIFGTFGYMAPEYVLHGIFSIKSDVFSYGVLVLEIITGEKSIEGSDQNFDLPSYVWMHWKEQKALEVVDKSIGVRYSAEETLRCIQIGLLCVQEEQIKRPKMASVNVMLSTPYTKLPIPSPPAFYREIGISFDSESFTGSLSGR